MNKNQTIAAMAFKPPGYQEFDNIPLVITLLENEQRVVAKLVSEISVDATVYVTSGSLTIDTARYHLAEGIRAFGLRINATRIPRCADAGTGEELALYVRDGATLRNVFGPTPTYYIAARQGGLCADVPVVDEWRMHVLVDKKATRGYHDLIIRFRSDSAENVECRFAYDGRRYSSDACSVADIPVR
ncbi:hypothetical protein [Tahibacter amnicola]|uniref:Inclusion body protein n=1 Tax=Tahibacter amnicola TaxID=2976241 RepID=A0ABY6B9V3_9GAMM|nr:hypothetical protein [Tahibacter amnicola]UXI65908.1 hypothetical protein N4264_14200 [Tahibacter amnicola]